jgi:hypothetical protein
MGHSFSMEMQGISPIVEENDTDDIRNTMEWVVLDDYKEKDPWIGDVKITITTYPFQVN